MNVSPFDSPLLSGLLGDEEAAACFSAEADIAAMIVFERALADAQAAMGIVPAETAAAIGKALSNFRPDVAGLRTATARDGVVVPELVRQMRQAVGEPHGSHLHFGATSQDVVDTSRAMRIAGLARLLDARLDAIVSALDALHERDGAVRVMAHTRMQAALPVAAARKVESWRAPLLRSWKRLADATAGVAVLTLGGPVGTRDAYGDKGDALAARLATALGLGAASPTIHSERDSIVDYAGALSLVTGSLGKLGQDVALAAQSEVGEIALAGGGGSSAMPHKVNPVGAETLVTLARFNATLLSGMHQSLVHENERSGAAWTLEWMLLPQMAVATAASLRTAGELIPAMSFRALPET